MVVFCAVLRLSDFPPDEPPPGLPFQETKEMSVKREFTANALGIGYVGIECGRLNGQ